MVEVLGVGGNPLESLYYLLQSLEELSLSPSPSPLSLSHPPPSVSLYLCLSLLSSHLLLCIGNEGGLTHIVSG